VREVEAGDEREGLVCRASVADNNDDDDEDDEDDDDDARIEVESARAPAELCAELGFARECV